jgi:DoxX-like family
MHSNGMAKTVSKTMVWAGRVLSGLLVLFLTFDSVIKFVKPPTVTETFAHIGWPDRLALNLGIVLLVCTLLYAIPKTCILGAILLTGYLGGAVATHTRIGDPLFSHILFPVYLGVLLWGAVFLRDERVRALIPLRS